MTIAVIGAGTMGAGIALVAARAGHRVLLHDANPAAIQLGLAEISRIVHGQVEKGKIEPDEGAAQLARLTAAPRIAELATAGLVIEAIVEDFDVKVKVLAEVEAEIGQNAIVTTNTSSLSITVIAARLARPENVAGMHFFNPATVLPLVEVIGGHATDPAVLDRIVATAAAWGKAPVRCRSTPGFIVNRVARPFYGEALRLLSEGVADAATIDALQKGCGGFRMGPFELMDMIGNDVNFAVTSSVYREMFGDPRYQPSLSQKALVEAGWLGRKSGRGFFDYRDGAIRPNPATAPEASAPAEIFVAGSRHPVTTIAALSREAGITVLSADGPAGVIKLGGVYLAPTDGRLAIAHAADYGGPTVLFDLSLDYLAAERIALAPSDGCPPHAAEAAAGLFQALGKQVSIIDDAPGLVVARTWAMLVNEAADALHSGVATAHDIDLSMTKGVNYPIGPLAAADRIGAGYFVEVLDNLATAYGEDRYRCSPLLRRKALSGSSFH